MRFFERLAFNVDVVPLLHAVQRQSELWNRDTLRTKFPGTPHSEVDDIWLRFQAMPEDGDVSKLVNEHESVNYPAFWHLPQARSIIFDLMRRVEGERLGRVLITRLAPGRAIALHRDGGTHAAYYDRYHVVLQNSPGCVFRAGAEAVFMAAGEVWWFDNAQEHEVNNGSEDDRVTMIVDIRTSR